MTFTLDVSGRVGPFGNGATDSYRPSRCWADLDDFTQGFVEAAFASLRSDDVYLIETLRRMRAIDAGAGSRPLIRQQTKALRKTCHWSRTHAWPSVCDDMVLLDWVRVQYRNEHGGAVTDPTNLGRAALFHLLGFSDLAPETLARFMEDCARKIALRNEGEQLRAYDAEAGRRFWMARNRGTLQPYFGPLTLYLNDEGRVCVREAP